MNLKKITIILEICTGFIIFISYILERPKPMERWSKVGSFLELIQSDQERNLKRCWSEVGTNYTIDGAELDIYRSAIGAKDL